MKIEALRIKGFRALHDVELTELDPKLNVFVGVNGVGKSSILDAIHLLLRKFQHAAMDKKTKVGINDDDVTQGLRQTALALRGRFQDRQARWAIERGGNILWEASEPRFEEDSLRDLLAQWKESWILPEPPANDPLPTAYPLIMHYPVTRAVLDIPLRVHQKKFGAWSAWSTGDDSGASFREFFTWFRNQEDLENERRVDGKPEHRDPLLSAVREAIEKLLPGYSNLHIRRWTPVRMLINKNGQEFAIQQLSDGEKCLLALVGDLARRLAMANPGAADPLKATGIVLIDELDIHLHPQWQIDVIPRLVNTFENCQFFISTHSPLLVSHARAGQVHLLVAGDEGVSVERPQINPYGQDMNLVVSAFMGTAVRETSTQNALQEIFATLADSENWREAKRMVAEVRRTNPDLPDLVKAQAILERKELLAK